MTFTDWLHANDISVAEAARRLGIGGVNPGGTLRRYITGERPTDADFIEAVRVFTGDAVTESDWHITRRNWIAENQPQRLRPVEPFDAALADLLGDETTLALRLMAEHDGTTLLSAARKAICERANAIGIAGLLIEGDAA